MSLSQGFTEDASGNTVVSGTVSANQTGTWNVTNISGTVSLPTGAATAAKQPALGTAGAASTDVITVQGIASMTALKVDGSAVTQPVSGTVTVTQATGTNLHVVVDSGSISTTLATSATATLTNVASSVTSGALLALNASRKGWLVYNDSTSVAYVNLGATASATAYSIKLQPNSFYENASPLYTGAINIIWASANGFARVTELT